MWHDCPLDRHPPMQLCSFHVHSCRNSFIQYEFYHSNMITTLKQVLNFFRLCVVQNNFIKKTKQKKTSKAVPILN